MKRRDLLRMLCIAATVPLVPRAYAATPVVGMVFGGSSGLANAGLPSLRSGLGELGYVEGQNVVIEYRFADGQYDRLPELVSDLVNRKVDVLVSFASHASLAAKAATSAIPIVFSVGVDPIALGLVAHLNRPEGNCTGATFLGLDLSAKQLELLHELNPRAKTIGFLINPQAPDAADQTTRAEAAARALGLKMHVVNARSVSDFEPAFADLVEEHADMLLVGGDEFFGSEAARIVGLAARHGIPAIYPLRVFTALGGMASYAASLPEATRQAGIYAGRILKGAKPNELPVVQASKFEFVVNLKTVAALGLTIPPSILVRADDVIE